MNNGVLVEVQNVTRNYGSRVSAVDDVSISIAKGEWLSIMGPSGSGKTTLLNIIGCLDRPTAGHVWIDGADITGLSPDELTRVRRETIGLVFQQFHLVPYLSALENVMLAQHFHSIADEPEARAALDRVGLGDRMHHMPSQLSGGEQQRACIARALINQPKLILADEPTGNLDRENEELVMEIFDKLHSEGHAFAVVTHDEEVGRKGQRLVRLDHGKVSNIEALPIHPASTHVLF